ncbi:hypothetical protein Tco_0857622 [Tanacetum coccineum]|uniref:Uncharacterized protein n=1 Tax=Tanacetum coccineum TaxID=301880 RepID=A0ABQ5B6Y8_9ASTR
MFTDYTTKVDSEPPNGSNDDITNPYECDQTLNVGAGFKSDAHKQMMFEQNSSSLVLQSLMTSVHISSGLALQRQMASADNTSGPAPQRKESVLPGLKLGLLGLLQFRTRAKTPSFLNNYVPPSKRDYEILFQPLIDEYFNPPPCVVSPDPVAVAAPRPVDPAGSHLSTTIDQDVPSASTSPTNQEIQFQVTHQGVEEQIHGHQNA